MEDLSDAKSDNPKDNNKNGIATTEILLQTKPLSQMCYNYHSLKWMNKTRCKKDKIKDNCNMEYDAYE